MYRPIFALFLTVAIAPLSNAADPASSAARKDELAKTSPVKLVDRAALKVDYGSIILLKYKSEAIALKFTRASDTANGGAIYRIWVNHRGPERFHEGRLTKIKGEVFEKIEDSHLNESESDTYARCGSFKLGWSKNGTDSGYVYFHNPKTSDLKIALTEWDRMKEIDFSSDDLQWMAWSGTIPEDLFPL